MEQSRENRPPDNSRGGRGNNAKDKAQALQGAQALLSRNIPPQNVEAERAVLGGVLLRNSILNSLVDLLTEDDFYSPAHRLIYQACLELTRRNTAIDLLTLADELRKRAALDEVGGELYLAELAEATVSAANALHHARIVREKSVQRQLITAAAEIIQNSFEGAQEVEELIDASEQSIFRIADFKKSHGLHSSKELIDQVFIQLEKRVESRELVTGVPTGYHQFDELTAGLQPSDLIILAARPAMGKTAFALNIAMNAAIAGVHTAVFSLEMSKEQLMMRLLCSKGMVDLAKLRRGRLDDSDWQKLYEAAGELSPAPLYIDDTSALTVLEMRSRCRRLASEHGLGLVIVDYLQLMRSSRRIDSREQEISDISRNLKALAKELSVPVIALSQLNRKVEERGDKRPMMSDLRESGAIEQDADLIVFLYREAAYKKRDEITEHDNAAEIIIGKQRNGPTGIVTLTFFKEFTLFENRSLVPPPSESAYYTQGT
jgi:replicative DNA helicase